MTRHQLVLMDELQPQIGTGHRWVEAKIGYKWVFVRERADGNRKRIKRQLWDTLVAQTERYLARQERFYKTKKESGEKKMIDALFANALMCMALNIYHEARNESTAGQLFAVGQVVVNRVYDDRFLTLFVEWLSRAFIGKAYQHVTGVSLAGTVMGCLINHVTKSVCKVTGECTDCS